MPKLKPLPRECLSTAKKLVCKKVARRASEKGLFTKGETVKQIASFYYKAGVERKAAEYIAWCIRGLK